MSKFIDGYDSWKLGYPPEWDEEGEEEENSEDG
jgi:hypothetical protein